MRLADLPDLPPRPHDFWTLAGRDLDVQVAGRPVRLHVKEVGSGPPLLLVHGLMTSAYSWRYVASTLGKRFHVVAPDLPGAGRSPGDRHLDMAPGTVAEVLRGLLDALGWQSARVVGNSLGGWHAAWLAAAHPERVERLVILHAPGFPEARLVALAVATRLPGAEAVLRWLTRDAEAFVLANVHYRDPGILSREETREYGRIFGDAGQAGTFFRILRNGLLPADMRRLHARLREAPLPMPVGLVWSTEDAMVPPWTGPRWNALVQGSRLVWMQDTSHFMHVDTPEATVSILDELLG